VSLSTSASIGKCDDIVIDPTESFGSGGRDWLAISWTVVNETAQSNNNTRLVATYLNSHYRSTSSLVTIPNRLVQVGVYQYKLTLTNFFGKSSSAVTRIEVIDSLILPRLAFAGPKSQSLYRYKAFVAYAVAVFPSCAQVSSRQLIYTYTVYLNGERVRDTLII
jgi:hypothetical protein